MQADIVIRALGALAQEHRLAAFRALVQAGAGGLSAGTLAETLQLPNSSLSFHLAHLNRAGLARQERQKILASTPRPRFSEGRTVAPQVPQQVKET